MTVYTNDRGEIKDVGTTTNPDLIEVEITDGTFDGWSDAKICCYKIQTDGEGHVIMMTPYTDSRNIEFYDRGRKAHSENSEGIFDVAELAGENSEAAYDLAEMVADLEERVAALEGKEG